MPYTPFYDTWLDGSENEPDNTPILADALNHFDQAFADLYELIEGGAGSDVLAAGIADHTHASFVTPGTSVDDILTIPITLPAEMPVRVTLEAVLAGAPNPGHSLEALCRVGTLDGPLTLVTLPTVVSGTHNHSLSGPTSLNEGHTHNILLNTGSSSSGAGLSGGRIAAVAYGFRSYTAPTSFNVHLRGRRIGTVASITAQLRWRVEPV